jgi:hypothetical protein
MCLAWLAPFCGRLHDKDMPPVVGRFIVSVQCFQKHLTLKKTAKGRSSKTAPCIYANIKPNCG